MKRRLFVAIDFPKEIKDKISRYVGKVKKELPDITWEKKEQLHLTLKFIGSTQYSPELITKVIEKKVRGEEVFTLQFGDIGMFLKGKSVLVFLDVVKTESLLRIYHKVNNVLASLQVPRETRVFHPHVTLGKGKISMKHLPSFSAKFPIVDVSSITLFESKRSDKGSTYIKSGVIILPEPVEGLP